MPALETLYYRTKDDEEEYIFEFVTLPDGSERAYIKHHPSYQGRDQSHYHTHLCPFGGPRYISWENKVSSRNEMKCIATLWADQTQEYIKTGKALTLESEYYRRGE